MPFLSYAIPVCNEHKELDALLTLLITHKSKNDEIVVQCDQGNTTLEVYQVLDKFVNDIRVVQFPLKGDFATFKNNLKKACKGGWIFQIDADESLHPRFISFLPELLRDNPTVELICVPRINTVEGLAEEHIKQWRWNVNEKGWVNFPDVQTRIIQNSPRISWVGKVHEVITGHTSHAILPLEELYCILHHKDIRRQEQQNTFYNLL